MGHKKTRMKRVGSEWMEQLEHNRWDEKKDEARALDVGLIGM